MSYPSIHKGGRSGAAFTRSPSGVFDFASVPTPGVILSRYLIADELAELIWFDNEAAEIDDYEISDDSADCWDNLRYIKTAPRSHFIYGHSDQITLDFATIELETGQSPQGFGGDGSLHMIQPFPFYGFGNDSYPGGGQAISPPADDVAPKSVLGEFGAYGSGVTTAQDVTYDQQWVNYFTDAFGSVNQIFAAHYSAMAGANVELNEYWNILTTGNPAFQASGFGGDHTHVINPQHCEYDPVLNRLFVSYRQDTYDAGDYTPPGVRPPQVTSSVYRFAYMSGPDESHTGFWGLTTIFSSSGAWVESIVAKRGAGGGVFGVLRYGTTREIFYTTGTGYTTINIFTFSSTGNIVVRWSESLEKVFFTTRELNDDDPQVMRARVKTMDADGTDEAVWLEFDGYIYGMEVVG